MFAVIKTGGKQYRVEADDVLRLEKLPGESGDIITFDEVLMVGGEGKDEIGSPLVDGACVSAEIIDQGRGRKIIVFKKKRRQNYRRKAGHRQYYTSVRISEILTGGAKPSAKPAAKKDDSKKADAKKADAKADKTDGKDTKAQDKDGAKDKDSAKDKAAKDQAAKDQAAKDQKDKDKTADKSAKDADAGEKPGLDDPNRPNVMEKPDKGDIDNLKLIKGVGTVLENKLHGLGIYKFSQIAEWTQDNIDWVDGYLSFKGRIERDEWIKQAGELAAGGETEFAERVKKGKVSTSKDKK